MATQNTHVSEEKLQQLFTEVNDALGPNSKGLRVCYRDEKAPDLYWGIINTFFKLLGKIDPKMLNFAQGGGRTVMLPNRKNWGDLTDVYTYRILRHEAVHIRDQARWGILYLLSYVLFLPAVLTMRAHWEWRGYAQNLIVWHEVMGYIPDSVLTHVEAQFTRAAYVWMFPFKKTIRAKLQKLKAQIEAGEVKGSYPDLALWR